MNIDFGPVTIDCELQDLLSYDEYDPNDDMTVTGSCATRTSNYYDEAATLSKPYGRVCEEAPDIWGAQFAFVATGPVNHHNTAALVGIHFSSAVLLYGNMATQYSSILWKGSVSGNPSPTETFDFGTTYIVKVYTYVDHAAGRRVDCMEVWSESGGSPVSMLDKLEYRSAFLDPWRGVDPVNVKVLISCLCSGDGYWFLPCTHSICNLYVGALEPSPVLPMIRNQSGTLGHQLIR